MASIIMDYDAKDPDYKKETVAKKYYLVKEEPEQQQVSPSFDQIFKNIPVGGSIASMPQYNNGTIIFTSLDTHIYTIDAETGEMLWKLKTGGPSMSNPLIHNEKIYFGSNDEHFYCLDLDGKLIWKKKLGGIVISYASALGNEIFIAAGRTMHCLNDDGREIWRFVAGDGMFNCATFVNDSIFASSFDGVVYALDFDGNLKWRFTTGGIVTSPTISSDGKPLFTLTTRSWNQMPKAKNPRLYFASNDNNVYSIKETGELVWKYNVGSASGGGIAFDDKGNLYMGNMSGYLHCIGMNGVGKWSFRTGGIITSTPTYHNGQLFVNSWDQKIYCLSEGEKTWDFLTGGPIIGGSTIIGNKIYFGSADTFLYCLNIEKRTVEWTFQCGFGLPENLQSKIGQVSNTFIEHDKKIFRVWVPETKAAKTQQSTFMQNYNMPADFKFGGEMAYSSSNVYETSNRRAKRSPYDK